jgi:uncharacterized nucleotidyltransferase DUF6036
MFDEFKELLSIFNAKSVRYLVVGGYAVSLHTQPRNTQDIDIFIALDPENADRVYAALQEFGAPLEGLQAADFAQRGKFFRMGRAPLAVDILPEIDGLSFDQAWRNRTEIVIDQAKGLKAFFISSEDLIANKLASGRPQDIADVAALRDAAKTKG